MSPSIPSVGGRKPNPVLVQQASQLTCELQVGSVLQQLLLHAAQRFHDHVLHLLLFAVGDDHEGGEEFALFLTGVLQPARCYLEVSLHVEGLETTQGGRTADSFSKAYRVRTAGDKALHRRDFHTTSRGWGNMSQM